MEHHSRSVAAIAAKVRQFHAEKVPFRIYHGYTNSTRKTSCQRNHIIDTSGLTHVLRVDDHFKTALVEPNVSMERLVRETLRHGLVPPVVPEFPGITIGGGFAGTAGESSSFRHGFLDNTINWIEIVLPDGEVVMASNTVKPDLFHGIKGTFGTLGVTTLLEIRLIEAKSYVELTYRPVNNTQDLILELEMGMREPSLHYIDAIQYSKCLGVVIMGRLTSDVQPGTEIQTFLNPRDEWYYLHVQRILAKASTAHVEAVPIIDYLFRYDRGAFWTGKYAFAYFAIPFLRILRWALDSVMHTKVLYHGLHENGMASDNIIQDIAVPISEARLFLHWLDENYSIYPLWICPFRQGAHTSMYPRMRGRGIGSRQAPLSLLVSMEKIGTSLTAYAQIEADDNEVNGEPEMLLSIGIWGPRLPDPKDFVAQNRRLERKVKECGGMKWLYAHCHYTKEEFWQIYDKQWYDDLRAKFNAEYLPSVYDKTKYDWSAEQRAVDGSWLRWFFSFVWWLWPMPGVYGLVCVFMHSEYLLLE